MRARGLAFLAFLAGCGGAKTANRPPTNDPSTEVTATLAEAVKLVRARKLVEAERLLADHRALAAQNPTQLEKVDYYLATVMAYRGELMRAQRLLAAHAESAANRGDNDSEAWMVASLTWIAWASGDLDGALAANDRLAAVAQGEDIDAPERRAWTLQQLWDRAFLLTEQAARAPATERSAAVAKATEARHDYETLAGDPDDRLLAALTAWMSWRAGDFATAKSAIDRLSLEDDPDPRSLFVAAVVCFAVGDRPRAERARARLGGMVNLLVPLLLRARVSDASGPS